jgi:4-amino-4-deoxy-L-arabinose transferase-like glycosyltransferase
MLANIKDRTSNIINSVYLQYGLLFTITLLAAIFRFYKLGDWSFWIDEIYTINRAQVHYGNLEAVLRNIPPARIWTALSTILTAGTLNSIGVGEWSARLIPAIIGVLSIPILYFPTRRIFGWQVALIAALLLAISPWHIYWSQNARFYTSLMLFYSLAAFAFFRWFDEDNLKYMPFFFLFLYIAISERLLALLIAPVIFCYLLLVWLLPVEKPSGLRLRNLAILIVPVIAVGIIDGINFYYFGYFRFLGSFGNFFQQQIEDPFRQGTFIAYNIGIPLLTLSLFSGLYLLLKKNRAGIFVFLGASIPFILVTLLTAFFFTEERYALVTLPFWFILAAIAVKELFSQTKNYGKLLAVGVLILLVADAAGANLMYYHINHGNRRDWKGAFTLVQERRRESDIIVSTWPELGNYYLNQEVISWQDIGPDDVEKSSERIWFVVIPDMAWFWGSEDFYWWLTQNGELINVQYLRRLDNTNLFIYLYDPAPKITP